MDVSDTEEFVADMMSLLVSFSGKFYGKRNAERRKMSKNKKHFRTCTICKFSKNYNRFGYLEFSRLGWILICTNKCNKHFGERYSDVVETNEIPFNEKHKCLCVDDELKRLADEEDARRAFLKKLSKDSKN